MAIKNEEIKSRLQVYVNHLASSFRGEKNVALERAKQCSYRAMIKGERPFEKGAFESEGKVVAYQHVLDELEKLNKVIFNICAEDFEDKEKKGE